MSEPWDLVLYDQKNAWSPSLNASGRGGLGVGGFEVQMVQFASWCAEKGLDVLALTPCGGEQRWEDGVMYRDGTTPAQIRCKTLLTARESQIPIWIDADRIVTSCVDDPSQEAPGKFAHLKGRSTLVHLSNWQRSLYEELGHAGGVVVPSMISDWIYSTHPNTQKRGYVCVNAWNKGTDATLKLWDKLRPTGTLSVGSPYGAPADAYDRCARVGARWLGQLTPQQIVHALARAEAVFRVCERPETFGVTDAIAEAVGTRVHCLCTNGVGAARDVLSLMSYVATDAMAFEDGLRKVDALMKMQCATTSDVRPVPVEYRADYRVSTVMPQWLKVLGLEG